MGSIGTIAHRDVTLHPDITRRHGVTCHHKVTCAVTSRGLRYTRFVLTGPCQRDVFFLDEREMDMNTDSPKRGTLREDFPFNARPRCKYVLQKRAHRHRLRSSSYDCLVRRARTLRRHVLSTHETNMLDARPQNSWCL
ncbi:unnamed protein product [Ixodes persulcatus]